MFDILKDLISVHYYKTKEEAMDKVDTCFAMNKITDTEYVALVMLIDETYGDNPEEVVEA